MKFIRSFVLATSLLTGCSTLDQSLKLGSATGSLVGAASTYTAIQSTGANPSMADVGMGASIGMAVGLLSSYFIHESVVQDRTSEDQQTQVFFGDLPPSPFVIPNNKKKGAR